MFVRFLLCVYGFRLVPRDVGMCFVWFVYAFPRSVWFSFGVHRCMHGVLVLVYDLHLVSALCCMVFV